jgi:predicted ATPase
MIQSVTIENFKSFERATLPLAPLTLLIGANASGKSNAIEAMQLLAWLASGRPVTDLLYAVREEELSLRGGLNDLVWAVGNEITLGCEAIDNSLEPFRVSLEVTPAGLRITGAPVILGTMVLPGSQAAQADINKFIERLKEAPAEGKIETVIQNLERQATQIAIHESDPLARALRGILFLDADPRRMRQYSYIQETQLKRDGSGLSSVLCHVTEQEGQKARVLEIIRFLPEQDISDIAYLKTQRDEVMVQLRETFGGREVLRDAALLSDGTVRVLAIAAALFSVPEGSILVIEEIDNGVHPSRAEHLLAQIQKVAKERSLRVLLTTHNPALLDAMPLEAIPDIVACYRDPERGDSRLVRLEDLESYPELIAQGPVGRLLTKGILDRYLKAPEARDRVKKVERDLAWVEELRRQA